ncbi:hypothetical protein SCLCIDRAFT_27290 [Scleroderma citrinum Foug A]|uniref:Uncharacterized protein n=1 Tax=Scleroderma citrinum Foug A TaxID=1036808 RepID=A0A0C3A448_9AGAM|nr:hypothetical protein SCLCIDRAFT_27290 [Scleroderma citrinum Foug A]
MLNKRAALLGHVKNQWANSIDCTEGNGTPQNTATSNCSTGGISHTPTSTTPSLTTKATSINSAAPPAYKTPTPVTMLALHTADTTANLEESDIDFIMPISEAVKTSSKCKHAEFADAEYTLSDVDEVKNDGYNDTDSLQQTKKISCVTAMTNITIDKPAKKLRTSPTSDTMAEQSGKLAIVSTTSQTSSAGTNSAGMGGANHFCYMNGHLPPALQEDRKWTKQILPALLTWAGSLGDPWVISDQDIVWTLQTIVATVDLHFNNLDEICPGTPPVWQLSVWQSNFGSTTIALMANFLASDGDNTKSLADIQETCLELLDGFAFLYQDLDPTKTENAYQSYFFLHLFAHAHLHPCIGCSDIPRLNTDDLKEHGIKVAKSLCCSVVGYM